MKKVKLNGKLSLNKETVAKLNDEQMNEVKGGAFLSIFACKTKNCPAPSGMTDQACSCMSCTGDLCNTCGVC